jgi:hypothetical protein
VKTKYWVVLFGVLLVVCAGASLMFFGSAPQAQRVEIWSEGKLTETLDLSVDRVLTVESALGTNVITVLDGKVAVTQADCPDGYCMKRGFCDGGVEIVCLPNRLVLRFVGEQAIDGVVG